MNYNNIIVVDFETGSADNKTCEILQLAAIAIDGRKLTLEGSFCSYVKPENWANVQEGAIKVHGITEDKVKDAPSAIEVYNNFEAYTKKYAKNNSKYGLPIFAGYNCNFDLPILDRMAVMAGKDKNGKNKLFGDFFVYDLMHDIWRLTNDYSLKKWSNRNKDDMRLETVRTYLGMSNENAHDALVDVTDTALIIIKMMHLYRRLMVGDEEGKGKVCFEGAFANYE